MQLLSLAAASLLVLPSLGQRHKRQTAGAYGVTPTSCAPLETSYTTFTSLCTDNGTSTIHTHSSPVIITPSSYCIPSASTSSASSSLVSPLSLSARPNSTSPSSSSVSGSSTNSSSAGSTYSASGLPSLSSAASNSSSSSSNSNSETIYTTFTSLCTTVINGTSTTVAHTHSAPVYSSHASRPAISSKPSPGSYGPTGVASTTSTLAGTAPTASASVAHGRNATATYSSTIFKYSPSAKGNSTAICSGATLNVLGASLDWWYTQTFFYAVSTFSLQYNSAHVRTGWTLVPAKTTFDVSSALAAPTCAVVPVTYSSASVTLEQWSCFTTPQPVAAATTVIPQYAFTTINATAGKGPIPNVYTSPAPPSITVPNGGGSFQTGTPFVYFSAYEIVTKHPTIHKNRSRGCVQSTRIFNMSQPFSFEYTGPPVNGSRVVGADVTGDINPAFLDVVNQTAVVAGSWVAAPTLAVVVEEIYAAQVVFFPAAATVATEVTAVSLATPTAPLPSFLQPAPASTTALGVQTPVPVTNRVESTGIFLELPTQSTVQTGVQAAGTALSDQSPSVTSAGNGNSIVIAPFGLSTGGSTLTLAVAASAGQQVITAVFGGNVVTATAISILNQASSGGGPSVGNLVGAIVNAAQPTNALQVLSEALSPAGGNPTAAAILAGIGGGASGSGSGSGSGPGAIPLLTIGSNTFTANAATQFSLAPGATLTPGGTAVVAGTTVSLDSAATAVVVNGQTLSLVAHAAVTQAPLVTIGGTVYKANAGSTFDIGGTLLAPGQVITVAGTTISLAQGGGAIVINGQTQTLSAPAITQAPAVGSDGLPTVIAPPILTINGQPVAGNAGSSYIISGQTLVPGSAITITGPLGVETISLDSAADQLVSIISGMTMTSSLSVGVAATAAPVLTIGGQTFSALGSGVNGPTYLVNGQVLTAGQVETVTINGQAFIVSLSPSATVLLVEAENGNGQVTATTLETLFPGAVSASTQFNTASASASAGASGSAGSASSTGKVGSGAAPGAAPSLALRLSAVAVAVGSLVLAIWL